MSDFIKPEEIGKKTDNNLLFWLWFLVILLLALVFRLVFINSPLGSYDTGLLYLAKNYNLTEEMSQSIHFFRLGMIIPIKILVKLFGYSISTYYLIAFIFSLGLIAVIFLVCHRFFNLKIAVIASLIFSTSFFSLETGTVVLTDIPCTFYMLLSLFLFYLMLNSPNKIRKYVFLFISVLAGFLAYLTKIPNIVFLISLPVFELLTTRKIKYSLIFGTLFALFLVLESTYYYVLLGDPLASYHVTSKNVTNWILTYDFDKVSVLNFITRVPVNIFSASWTGKFALVGGIIGMGIGIFKKNIAIKVLFSGAMAFFIINSYIPISISPLVPGLPYSSRYFLTFQVVLIIGLAYFINWLWEKAKSIKTANILFVSLISLLLIIQTIELPGLMNHLKINNDSFSVADHLLKDYLQSHKINEPVYAFPINDFLLYPNFQKLKLKQFDPIDFRKTFVPGIYLFPKWRALQESTHYAPLRGDFNAINNTTLLLMNNKKEWDYLIDTRDIRLVNIPTIALTCNNQFNLFTNLDENFLMPENAQILGEGINIHLDSSQQFEFTSSANGINFNSAFIDDPAIIIKDALYQFNLEYEMENKLQKAILFWYEYNENGESTRKLNWGLFTTPGSHLITINVLPMSESTTYRFHLLLINSDQAINEVKLQKVDLSFCE